MKKHFQFVLLALCTTGLFLGTAEAKTPARFLVVVPERIDVEWFWYFYTAESQHLVQGQIEKRLVRDGFDVVDVAQAEVISSAEGDVEELTSRTSALRLAKALNATYLVTGAATATKAGHDEAYGVNVYRSSAEASLKLIRVEDGKVLDIFSATADEGGTAQRTAGRDALKALGRDLAKQVSRAAQEL